MPCLIQKLKSKLIRIYEAQDSLEQLRKFGEVTDKLKSISKDLKAYNMVFTPDYETFLDELIIQIRSKVSNSQTLPRQAYIQKTR